MTLALANAVACFNQMCQCLRKIHSKTSGVSPDYIICLTLKGPWDLLDAMDPDPTPFGKKGTPYVLIDHELVTQAPILDIALGYAALKQLIVKLESNGPFERSFITNSATVYEYSTQFGASQAGRFITSLLRGPRMAGRLTRLYILSSLVDPKS